MSEISKNKVGSQEGWEGRVLERNLRLDSRQLVSCERENPLTRAPWRGLGMRTTGLERKEYNPTT